MHDTGTGSLRIGCRLRIHDLLLNAELKYKYGCYSWTEIETELVCICTVKIVCTALWNLLYIVTLRRTYCTFYLIELACHYV